MIIHFETAEGEQITTSTGLSFVSSENAALNLETELGPLDYDFDKVVAQSKKEWNALLGSVEVKGKDSRMAANDFFSTSPYTAWLGEEDEGQMGALYNLLSIGLFEMKAGCSVAPYYDLSSPVFDVITIHLDQKYYPGEKFTIKVANNSPENDFIQSAELNGKKLQEPKILHKDIVEGGELTIDLGVAPN
ncbi:glycoside hydrolase domain-containing protein [Pricia sp.]|uniref:glycoside hydrolase domain-containing protein n=1 Tax=Pricia sp. TaxID=2268138 RepID=UPI0035936E9E